MDPKNIRNTSFSCSQNTKIEALKPHDHQQRNTQFCEALIIRDQENLESLRKIIWTQLKIWFKHWMIWMFDHGKSNPL